MILDRIAPEYAINAYWSMTVTALAIIAWSSKAAVRGEMSILDVVVVTNREPFPLVVIFRPLTNILHFSFESPDTCIRLQRFPPFVATPKRLERKAQLALTHHRQLAPLRADLCFRAVHLGESASV